MTRPEPPYNDRLLETLQQLLGIQAPELRPALDEASGLVATALRADKVDVYLYEAQSDSLVAMGTSDTEMGREQQRAGLTDSRLQQLVSSQGLQTGSLSKRSGTKIR